MIITWASLFLISLMQNDVLKWDLGLANWFYNMRIVLNWYLYSNHNLYIPFVSHFLAGISLPWPHLLNVYMATLAQCVPKMIWIGPYHQSIATKCWCCTPVQVILTWFDPFVQQFAIFFLSYFRKHLPYFWKDWSWTCHKNDSARYHLGEG
jgi:hypothetical protein